MSVDRCVCHQIKFEQLFDLLREPGATFDRVLEQTGCGSKCGLCLPYLKLMRVTGRTRFPVMNDFKLELQLRNATRNQQTETTQSSGDEVARGETV